MPNQKASTPWSTRTVAEGGTDSPVGDLVPIPDKLTPVVNTGFISLAGKYTGIQTDDLTFTFQDPNQAVGAGASMFIEPVNMVKHDTLILALVDSSGNDINVDIRYLLTGSPPAGTPYDDSRFSDKNVVTTFVWLINQVTSGANDTMFYILNDLSENLSSSWTFYKIIGLKGTVGNFAITSNEGADAGTLSSAYLRLV